MQSMISARDYDHLSPAGGQAVLEWLPEFPNRYYQLVKLNSMSMEPNNIQAQGLYRLCYRLTNAIYPG